MNGSGGVLGSLSLFYVRSDARRSDVFYLLFLFFSPFAVYRSGRTFFWDLLFGFEKVDGGCGCFPFLSSFHGVGARILPFWV